MDETASRNCPECGGSLIVDEEHGERSCEACGLVVDTDEIDRGPEWRSFENGDNTEKSRVGAPRTPLLHDHGLSTEIDWRNRDAHGRALSARKRTQIERLRTWNRRTQAKDSKERNLIEALSEIDRMASALGLPGAIRRDASVTYRNALDDGLLPGRSIEGVSTAVVYIAARQADTPRSIEEVVHVSRIGRKEFTRTFRYLVRELDLELAPPDPRNYLPRFASALDLPDEVEYRANELLTVAMDAGKHSGKNPVGLAAAALYAAAQLTNVEVTQETVGDVTGVSEVTIRNRYRDLLETDGHSP